MLVVGGDVPARADLDPLVGTLGGRHRHDHRLVLGEVVVADRGELRGETARRRLRHGQRVHRLLVGEPLREREPGVDPAEQHLRGHAVPLGDALLGDRTARLPGGVEALDPDRAALLGVPVGVHLADDQGAALREPELWAEAPLEAAVVGDVELAVVERGHGPRRTLGGVGPVHHLEGEVGGGAADPRDDVRRIRREVGVEVDGVGVVQSLPGVLVRRVDQHRVLEVVVEGHLQRGADAAGEVVVALREVLFRDLERRVGDQLLRLGDGLCEARDGRSRALGSSRSLAVLTSRPWR